MSGPYRRRVIDDELDMLLAGVVAVSLDGPRGVGKTATASQRARTVFALDDPAAAELFGADPDRLVSASPPVLVDEWQRVPGSWDNVRRAVDRDSSPGRFLLAGSAWPQTPPAHSGAGRIVGVRMRPLTLAERGVGTPSVSLATLLTGRPGSRAPVAGSTSVGLPEYTHQIVTGGFPGMRSDSGRVRRTLLRSYLDRVVARDFPEAGLAVRNPATLRRWLAAYAAATGTTSSYEAIRDVATTGDGGKPAKTTTIRYQDTLQRIWLSDPVPAWLPTRNHLRRLTQAPKHYLADPALAVSLTELTTDELLAGREPRQPIVRDGTYLGSLFEALAALSVRVFAQAAEARVAHLRTHNGLREIDFVVTGPDGRVVALEVKLARTVDHRDVRHLQWLKGALGDGLADMVVLTTGPDAYRRADGVAVVPLALLGP
jgi:hypothetical protein